MTGKLNLILVPTDFSPFSCEAFAWASLLAEKFVSKIVVLHVLGETAAEAMISVPGNPWESVLEREDKQMVESFSACLAADIDNSIDIETTVAVGPAHSKIVEVAGERDASMIVMATHGRTGLPHVLMGSVAEKVVRLAPCPVLSVKPKAMEGAKDVS
jgi:nucleotide-binding universal stress UspA family protein